MSRTALKSTKVIAVSPQITAIPLLTVLLQKSTIKAPFENVSASPRRVRICEAAMHAPDSSAAHF